MGKRVGWLVVLGVALVADQFYRRMAERAWRRRHEQEKLARFEIWRFHEYAEQLRAQWTVED